MCGVVCNFSTPEARPCLNLSQNKTETPPKDCFCILSLTVKKSKIVNGKEDLRVLWRAPLSSVSSQTMVSHSGESSVWALGGYCPKSTYTRWQSLRYFRLTLNLWSFSCVLLRCTSSGLAELEFLNDDVLYHTSNWSWKMCQRRLGHSSVVEL